MENRFGKVIHPIKFGGVYFMRHKLFFLISAIAVGELVASGVYFYTLTADDFFGDAADADKE